MEYEIELSGGRSSHYWTVRRAGGTSIGDDVADGVAPDEPTARKISQAVIDALSPQPTTPTDAELMPCPFCGCAESPFVGGPSAACGACGAEGPVDDTGTRSEVAKLWNQRAQPTTPTAADYAAELADLRRELAAEQEPAVRGRLRRRYSTSKRPSQEGGRDE